MCTNFANPQNAGTCNACKAAGAGASAAAASRAAAAAAAPPPPTAGAAAAPLSDEADLALALAESAALHTASVSELLVVERYELPRAHAEPPRDGGIILQLGVINQFHGRWLPLVSEHGAPAAICGYTAFAHACLLAELAGAGALPSEPAALRDACCDFESVAPRVGATMSAVRAARLAYVAAHPADFDADGARAYTAAWVANYELSDLLRALPPEVSSSVVFVRINEGSQIGEATHEERERLREEAAIESTFLVEQFGGARRLLTPAEALAAPARAQWRVAVLDVYGHFVVAAPAGRDLVVLNTTSASYLKGWGARAAAIAHDVLLS
jgi:hypothetical protein